jgi:hypothetical protein
MAIDWSKIDKKSLALLVGMCILFNWVNGKLVPWMENKWKWRGGAQGEGQLSPSRVGQTGFPRRGVGEG